MPLASIPLRLNPSLAIINRLELNKDLENKLFKDIKFKYLYKLYLKRWYVLGKNRYKVYLFIIYLYPKYR